MFGERTRLACSFSAPSPKFLLVSNGFRLGESPGDRLARAPIVARGGASAPQNFAADWKPPLFAL